ncbi:MAG: LemA family protein [Candidatus Pacearchaeota archaeon]|jgi:LemA protein
MVALLLWLAPLLIIALIVIIFIAYYNKFVIKGNRIDNALAQIDVQLKRRADLIPNLIETVKGYAKHEKSIIADVTNARKALISAGDLKAKVKANDNLERALKSIFALAENYPNLKANENFLQLQTELSATEDKVAYSRQYYNDSILDFNNSIKVFPGKLFASIFSVKERPFIEIAPEERKTPKVNF